MKKLRTLISHIVVYALTLYSVITSSEWSWNIVVFFTVLIFVVFVVNSTGNPKKKNPWEPMIDTYNRTAEKYHDRNLPLWFDACFYAPQVLTCIAGGNWIIGIMWFVIFGYDLELRKAADKLRDGKKNG